MEYPIDWIRSQFPALERTEQGRPVVYFDGPAGSQVPVGVADAVHSYLLGTNANHAGVFGTAVASDAILHEAHRAMADLLGAGDPDCIAFGANMTTLTLSLSRAIANTWNEGDEIVVSGLDHDANVTPWTLAARDRGVTVRRIALNPEDWTLDPDSFREALSERTRLVAVGYAANATGTINPVRELIAAARDAGALTFVDAVHYAPHGLIDVEELGCDFLVASAYKFFGPHVGVLYGRRALLEELVPYKLRPAPESLPGRWMTGTQNHEGMAGAAAAVEYLAEIGGRCGAESADRRSRLVQAFAAIQEHERSLSAAFLRGLSELDSVQVHGITDMDRLVERVPTVSMTFASAVPREVNRELAARGIYAWAGNHYALPFTESAGLEPNGTLRVGGLHYNTVEEVERLVRSLAEILS